MSSDALRSRLRAYEREAVAPALDPMLPICARITLDAMASIVRAGERPFDPRLINALIETAQRLVRHSLARVAYVNALGVTLIWKADTPGSFVFEDGRTMRMTASLSASATAVFNRSLGDWRPLAERPLTLEATVFQLPSMHEAANALLLHHLDWGRTVLTTVCQGYYGAQGTLGKSHAMLLRMLEAKGVALDDLDPAFRFGAFVRREVASPTGERGADDP